ncbi:hypothetical protein [Sinorhizobium fredii]|uniref:hypothetical protein n=1 Tax=Rhizobium fredii TaxID=380 RepID=UPI003513AE57
MNDSPRLIGRKEAAEYTPSCVGKDDRDMRKWVVTDEGRAKIQRTDTRRNWEF